MNDFSSGISGCYDEYFVCNNGKCLYPVYRCDTIDDCGDESDEKGCGK